MYLEHLNEINLTENIIEWYFITFRNRKDLR